MVKPRAGYRREESIQDVWTYVYGRLRMHLDGQQISMDFAMLSKF